jgi:hypothetical protein
VSHPFRGKINIDVKDSTPDWVPYQQSVAPDGAPGVLYVVLDDVGSSALEPFGGMIETRLSASRPGSSSAAGSK